MRDSGSKLYPETSDSAVLRGAVRKPIRNREIKKFDIFRADRHNLIDGRTGRVSQIGGEQTWKN